MEKTTLRKLNDALNHAQARLNRAHLAAEIAEIEVRHLKNAIAEGVTKFQGDLTSPRYDVYVAGFEGQTPNKIGAIKAVRELTNLGLKEAKDVIDFAGTPSKSVFLKGVDFTFAEKARKMLREHGAVAELRSAQ